MKHVLELKDVIAYGPGWMVIHKPPGMSVHNDPDGLIDAISAAGALLRRAPELSELTKCKNEFGLHPVHRLDRDTSGVLLLATDKSSASQLQKALASSRTTKIYRAILRGPLPESQGHWDYPLSEKSAGRRHPQGPPQDRKDCRTGFELVRQNKYLCEVRIRLETGRQHQIRRHAALASHEVIGDRRYGDPRYNTRIERLYGLSRLMLHAHRLEVPLDSGEVLVAEAPLPPDFHRLFEDPPSGGRNERKRGLIK